MNTSNDIVIDIIGKISKGIYCPGDKLPTESEFLQQYGVSKMTVRKALDRLKALNIITTVERIGSFIRASNGSLNNRDNFQLGYSVSAILNGFKCHTEILNFEVIKPTKLVAEKLQITQDEDVYFIKRLRYLDDIPSAIEISYIVKADIPELEAQQTKESLYSILYDSTHKMVTNVSSSINAIIPSDDLKSKLQLDEGEAVFYIEKVSKIDDQRNFEYVFSFQAGNRINI